MSQKEKVEVIKRAIAEYFNEVPENICTSNVLYPAPLMRYILCYQLLKRFSFPLVSVARISFPYGESAQVYRAIKCLKKLINDKPEIKQAVIQITETIDSLFQMEVAI